MELRSENASCALGRKENERKTNMFKALEARMKADASTRKALEKCIAEVRISLAVYDFGCFDNLEG